MKKEKVETKTGGKDRIYTNDQGEKIETFKEALDWIVTVKLEPLRNFLEIAIDGVDDAKELFIAQALLERAEEKISEAADYIREHHGEIQIERAMHHQSIEPETMLGIVFTPSNGQKAKVTA
jgi:hypothetical protein